MSAAFDMVDHDILPERLGTSFEMAAARFWRLGCYSMAAEMNMIDADLRKLLSTAQPDDLRFLKIQLQTTRGHPSYYLFKQC